MYVEYFNIISSGPASDNFSVMLSISLILAVMIYFRFRKSGLFFVKIIPFVFVITLVVFIVVKYQSGSEYREFRDILINKKHQTVEGVVQNFIPMDENRGISESFTVNGISFSYHDYNNSSAFNESRGNGGPVYEGVEVRILYYHDYILGLWIRE